MKIFPRWTLPVALAGMLVCSGSCAPPPEHGLKDSVSFRLRLKPSIDAKTGEKRPDRITMQCERLAPGQLAAIVNDPDAGVIHPDAGVIHPDAGVFYPDAGVFYPDGGVFYPDAGVIHPDGGVIYPGAGVRDPGGGVIHRGVGVRHLALD